MTARSDLMQMITQLPEGNLADVHRYVGGILAAREGPAQCQSCNREIANVKGMPACEGTVKINGKTVPCANTGLYWRTLSGP